MSARTKVAAAVVALALGAWTLRSGALDAARAGDAALAPGSVSIPLVEPEPAPVQLEEPERRVEGLSGRPLTGEPASSSGRMEPGGTEPVSLSLAVEEGLDGGEDLDGESRPLVSGRVLDENGEPTSDAHVSIVADGGSTSSSTSNERETLGEFAFDRLWRSDGEYAVKASTHDGRIAVLGGLRLNEPLNDLLLVLEQGGTIALSLDGERDRVRCALISDAVWFEDFTLRKGKPRKEVVPPGPVLIQLYNGVGAGKVVHEERAVNVGSGEEREVAFHLVQ